MARPTDYRPEYCEQVIELGKAGKSKVQMACAFDVVVKTLDNWADDHPEFLHALTCAMQHSQDWWERAAQENLTADKFQASLWSRSMAARFPKDYRESTKVQLGGDPDNPEPVKTITRIELVAPSIGKD